MPDKSTLKDTLKSLFEPPQKARNTILCSLVTLATLGAVAVYAVSALWNPGADVPPSQTEAVSDAPSQLPSPGQSDSPADTEAPTQILVGTVPSLSIDEARELALNDAGVDESQAEISREALSQDNGIWVYEFRFRTEQARYEYLINANTGEVRSMVKEIFVYPSSEPVEQSLPAIESDPPAETGPQPSATPQPVQSTAPTATPAPTPNLPTSKYIGVNRAKAIALEHAGLSASEARFTQVGMDREQGTTVYEIEFRQGRVEYEYKIDAATGRILDYEWDQD